MIPTLSRAIRAPALAASLSALVWPGHPRLSGSEHSAQSQAAAPDQCVVLLAEKTRALGRVCVALRADSLIVNFEADSGWRITETHLAVAGDLNGLPLAGGRQPVLGRFPYKHEHSPGVARHIVAISPAERPVSVGPEGIVLAAHATLLRNGIEEGAWATGTPFTAEGSPAAYFRYRPASR